MFDWTNLFYGSVWESLSIVFSLRLQELTVCSEDTVDVHDIELMQYINVDCSKVATHSLNSLFVILVFK